MWGLRAAEKLAEIHHRFKAMSESIQRFEREFDKLEDCQRRLLEKVTTDCDSLRRRIDALEARFDAVVERSTKEAMIQVIREYVREGNGTDWASLQGVLKALACDPCQGAPEEPLTDCDECRPSQKPR